MQTIGIIEQVIVKSNPPKRIAVIADCVNIGCSWAIEFRKSLMHKAGGFKSGDKVDVSFTTTARIDSRENTYNNAVAEKIERL
ncbi:hypothetical protein [Joostella sp.]|uniref:hypothetical protein n=1 Tax=Joostella sp. TaxID=2231138 RepID=UPI003A8CC52D